MAAPPAEMQKFFTVQREKIPAAEFDIVSGISYKNECYTNLCAYLHYMKDANDPMVKGYTQSHNSSSEETHKHDKDRDFFETIYNSNFTFTNAENGNKFTASINIYKNSVFGTAVEFEVDVSVQWLGIDGEPYGDEYYSSFLDRTTYARGLTICLSWIDITIMINKSKYHILPASKNQYWPQKF